MLWFRRTTVGGFLLGLMISAAALGQVEYEEGASLRVIGSEVLLRESPHRGGAVQSTLSLYDHLEFLGEYTVEPVTVRLRGDEVTAPYILVRADDGTEGWVFEGLVETDTGDSLFERTAELIRPGDSEEAIRQLYGQDLTRHVRGMRSPYTQNLLDRLGTEEALEFYSYRTGEGIAFGLRNDTVRSVRIRQDRLDNGALTVYWRTVDGYLEQALRPECHQTPDSSSCSDYLR